MNNIQPSYNDEIDIFELFETLRKGKWKICFALLVSCLLTSCFLFFQDAKYKSDISYFVYNKPPFINDEKILKDFKNIFYSNNEFQRWKNNNNNSILNFKNVTNIVFVDGFKLTKNEENLLIKFSKSKKVDSYLITINSKSLEKITDVYKYIQFLNNFLKTSYVSKAEKEYNFLKERINAFPDNVSNAMINQLLEVGRFIDRTSNGTEIIKFQLPSIPKKISPNIRLILIMSLIMGGIIGSLFVLIYDAKLKHKEKQS